MSHCLLTAPLAWGFRGKPSPNGTAGALGKHQIPNPAAPSTQRYHQETRLKKPKVWQERAHPLPASLGASEPTEVPPAPPGRWMFALSVSAGAFQGGIWLTRGK